MSSRNSIYFCNGRYLPASKAMISVRDLGVMRGFGIFESLRTYDGHPFRLDAHLERLWKGLQLARLPAHVTRGSLARIVRRLIKQNGSGDLLIRIVLTGGFSNSIVPENRSSVVVMVDPLHRFPPLQYEKGIALMSTRHSRILPQIKTTVYFSAVMETMRARRRGFDEVVYLDADGAILEGTTFNVFAALPGPQLVTPRDGVLAGITAGCVIQVARTLHIPVQRGPITAGILRRAQEVFITSSNRELIPAVRVDREPIGERKPGPITKRLHFEYGLLVRKEASIRRRG